MKRRHVVVQSLVGGYGSARAVASWGLLVALIGAAFVGGGLFSLAMLLVVIAVSVSLAMAAAGTATRVALAGLGLSLVASIGYVFAAVNVGVDAADAGLASPAWTNFVLAAMGVGVLSFVALVGVAVRSIRREALPGA